MSRQRDSGWITLAAITAWIVLALSVSALR